MTEHPEHEPKPKNDSRSLEESATVGQDAPTSGDTCSQKVNLVNAEATVTVELDQKYRVVLECFQGDLTILYHLCKVGELDVLKVPILDILRSLDSNRSLFDRVFDLVVVSYLLNLKVARLLDSIFKQPDVELDEADSTLRLAVKSYYSDWLLRATESFLSHRWEGMHFKYTRAATFNPGTISKLMLHRTAKRLLVKKSSFQVYLSTFISRIAQKIRDVVPFKHRILEWLKHRSKLKVRELSRTRLDAVGLFLASLELAKDGNVEIIQQGEDVVVMPASTKAGKAVSGL